MKKKIIYIVAVLFMFISCSKNEEMKTQKESSDVRNTLFSKEANQFNRQLKNSLDNFKSQGIITLDGKYIGTEEKSRDMFSEMAINAKQVLMFAGMTSEQLESYNNEDLVCLSFLYTQHCAIKHKQNENKSIPSLRSSPATEVLACLGVALLGVNLSKIGFSTTLTVSTGLKFLGQIGAKALGPIGLIIATAAFVDCAMDIEFSETEAFVVDIDYFLDEEEDIFWFLDVEEDVIW